MHINFIRNIQFTKLLKTEGRLREFNFRKLTGLNEGLITVDVSDDRVNSIMVRIEQHGQGWRLYNPRVLPNWIVEKEQRLSEIIEAELREIA